MRNRIANLPPDFGSIVGLGLVFAGLHPHFGLFNVNKYVTDTFPADEGDLLVISQTLYFGQGPQSSRYLTLLTESLTDPGRAGEHALDGPKCALVAGFLLDCLILPRSERNVFHDMDMYSFSSILFETGMLLSKASHSDELVTRINHTVINCEFFTSYSKKIDHRPEDYTERSLRTLIKVETGDYLTRVIGSVPIDLKIRLQVYKRPDALTPMTFSLFYYRQ